MRKFFLDLFFFPFIRGILIGVVGVPTWLIVGVFWEYSLESLLAVIVVSAIIAFAVLRASGPLDKV
jgi:hypothetical protein